MIAFDVDLSNNLSGSTSLNVSCKALIILQNCNTKYTIERSETKFKQDSLARAKKDSLNKDFMLRGFSVESSNTGIYYASMGVNGASSNSFLRCPNFVNELKSIPPDLVILSLGVNDVHGADFTKEKFKTNYDSLITLIKQVSPNAAILFTTTTDNYIRRKIANKCTALAQQAMFELMEKHNAGVYDTYAVMGGYKSIYKWYKAGLANKDKVHFNGRGYNLLAGLMFEAIDKSYKYNSKVK